MTTYASQNLGAGSLVRVKKGLHTALTIGCVYSAASFVVLRFADKLLISLFLDSSETAIMANAQEFIFWNSAFFIPLAVLSYRLPLYHSGAGLFRSGDVCGCGRDDRPHDGRVLVCAFVGYFGACLANPAAWLFACAFLIPAFLSVMRRLQKEYTSAAN